jgi:hypothetical protein
VLYRNDVISLCGTLRLLCDLCGSLVVFARKRREVVAKGRKGNPGDAFKRIETIMAI